MTSESNNSPQPTYTEDWTSRFIDTWLDLFTQLGWIGKPDLHFLEIGCFEGRTTRWLLEHVLTDSTSRITVVDTFEGSPEHGGIDRVNLATRFIKNITPAAGQVNIYARPSLESLCEMHRDKCEFDFIFVDGSHRAADVLTDGVLAWPLLRPDGVMIFDDYTWQWTDPRTGEAIEPTRGIDAWLHGFQGQYELLLNGGQVGVRKR